MLINVIQPQTFRFKFQLLRFFVRLSFLQFCVQLIKSNAPFMGTVEMKIFVCLFEALCTKSFEAFVQWLLLLVFS